MTDPLEPAAELIAADVARALAEDGATRDASGGLIDGELHASATVICRDPAILAGRAWFDACFLELDPAIVIDWDLRDGDRVAPGSVVCRLRGRTRAILSAERSALNFLQTLSGTATVTRRYVDAVQGSRTVILDTRKTLPGLRQAQKYAVRCGGGTNHRMGLADAILIKENHIAAAGSITAAVAEARRQHPELLLEVEVENFDELEEALAAATDRIMLDEFDDAAIARAVTRVAGTVPLEVSGSVELPRVAQLAALGVDFISVGALTKHLHAVDLSLRIEPA